MLYMMRNQKMNSSKRICILQYLFSTDPVGLHFSFVHSNLSLLWLEFKLSQITRKINFLEHLVHTILILDFPLEWKSAKPQGFMSSLLSGKEYESFSLAVNPQLYWACMIYAQILKQFPSQAISGPWKMGSIFPILADVLAQNRSLTFMPLITSKSRHEPGDKPTGFLFTKPS